MKPYFFRINLKTNLKLGKSGYGFEKNQLPAEFVSLAVDYKVL